jgi:hypothetical protein
VRISIYRGPDGNKTKKKTQTRKERKTKGESSGRKRRRIENIWPKADCSVGWTAASHSRGRAADARVSPNLTLPPEREPDLSLSRFIHHHPLSIDTHFLVIPLDGETRRCEVMWARLFDLAMGDNS